MFAAFSAGAAGAAEKNPAADYPSKPIRFVVAFQAGGANDITARIVAQKLTERWGRQVVTDNRPGAAGSVGVDATAFRRAPEERGREMAPAGEETACRWNDHRKQKVATRRLFIAQLRAQGRPVKARATTGGKPL